MTEAGVRRVTDVHPPGGAQGPEAPVSSEQSKKDQTFLRGRERTVGFKGETGRE